MEEPIKTANTIERLPEMKLLEKYCQKLLEKYCQHLVKAGKKLPFKLQDTEKDNLHYNILFILAIEVISLTGLITLTIVYLTNLDSIDSIEENRMKIIWLFYSVNFSMCVLAVLFVEKILNPYLEKHDL